MPQTITEKILAAHAGRDTVTPGELINVRIDMALANDITAPIAIDLFEKSRVEAVFDPERIALVPDHFVPNKDVQSAIQVQAMRTFARKYHIKHFFELGEMGIEHVLLPEQG
ncbi:MAG: 3-isopropylmalate dehydratase large subunit, partial [Desulfobacterales bacterium]|nr:3-isopropylmalate dehydratase large subunit [Desulfobacterales bacterium]